MSYLCLRAPKPESNQIHRTATTVATTSVMSSYKHDDSIILPTFTAGISGYAEAAEVRCLKDSGCQRNFIIDSLAKKLKLKILEPNLCINITGFNENKVLKTKVVEIPITVGGSSHVIEALSVPQIPIAMTLDNLKSVARNFMNKGYVLADKTIQNSNKIDNIALIIGADADYILDITYVNFGSCSKSSYMISNAGVILTGSIPRLLTNLPHLPVNSVSLGAVQQGSDSDTIADEYDAGSGAEDADICTAVRGERRTSVSNCALDTVTEEECQAKLDELLNCDHSTDDHINLTNDKLTNYVLQATERADDGRLIMPLLWNDKVAHLLSTNYGLAKSILYSNFAKLKKEPDKLLMYDAVLQEQIQSGVIEEVKWQEVDEQNLDYSYLAHMGVYRFSHDTTKCRVVYMSNLSEKSKTGLPAMSHNQVMMPGPNLNCKITSALLHLRFDKYLLVFDLVKAFLTIGLKEWDQNKLMLLWFKNVQQEDFSLVTYKCRRLCFGLRCSPCLLMLALYKILIVDTDNDDSETVKLKKQIYHSIYMDNGALTSNDETQLFNYYDKLPLIFQPYCFALQQFATNESALQMNIDSKTGEQTDGIVKLLGMQWDRSNDTLNPVKINVDIAANTKRLVLSAVNEIYDVFNVTLPTLNRAKLFLQKLQINPKLGWDTKFSPELQKEWTNIGKQLNEIPCIKVPRAVGKRSDSYDLIAFTDSSRVIYGTVIYLRNRSTGEVNFVVAKNRLITRALSKMSIPSLELQALNFGVASLLKLKNDLCGDLVVNPIKIISSHIYTDSMVCIHWVINYSHKFTKMQKRSNFVLNRLKSIEESCQYNPITFHYIEGYENPADYVTRPISYKLLANTVYLTGPSVLRQNSEDYTDSIAVRVPNEHSITAADTPVQEEGSCALQLHSGEVKPIVASDRYSSVDKLINVTFRY